MSLTDEQLIEKYGKKDGHDEARLEQAKRMAGHIDRSVETTLISFINLENKGLIELKTERGK